MNSKNSKPDTFNGVNVSSKFSICGLPIRLDTYKSCSFGCVYCFANARKVMEFRKELKVADVGGIERRLERVKRKGFKPKSLLDTFISKGITWHCGGMSDPFQPCECELGVTRDVVDVTNRHGVKILFSTKSDTVYDVDIRPDLHSFQLSVSNCMDRTDIEPCVPSLQSRKRFFNELKKMGFKVGVRIQPFIPGVTTVGILEEFSDADHFTIEGLKMVPQNHEQIRYLVDVLGIDLGAFQNDGLYTLRPSIRLQMYEPFISWLRGHGKSYSVSDNDMRWEGNNSCCCGDCLVSKSSCIDTTYMIRRHGVGYGMDRVMSKVDEIGIGGCKFSHLFTSNRCEFGETVGDFYSSKFKSISHPCCPRYQIPQDSQMEMFPVLETFYKK